MGSTLRHEQKDRDLKYVPTNSPSQLKNSKDTKEKCYNPNDTTLTFVDGEDDMDCK